MEKYYISNDIRFLTGLGEGGKLPESATHMKRRNAEEFVALHPKYMWFKARNSSKGKDYVICTPMKFVGNDNNVTSDIKKAKAFSSIEDACSYLNVVRDHLDGDINQIIDEKFRRKQIPSLIKEDISPMEIFSFANMDSTDRIVIPKNIKDEIFKMSGGVCPICGKVLSKYTYTIDHIIPLSRGGTNEPANLRAVHKHCNRLKGNFTDAEMMSNIRDVACNNIIRQKDAIFPAMIFRSYVRGCIARNVTN